MKEIIILELSEGKKSQLVQSFLKQKNIDYRLLSETQPEASTSLKDKETLKKRLIEAYQREAKNEEFQKEMEIWESLAGDGISDE